MKKFFIFTLIFSVCFAAFGQSKISYNGSGNYELVERTNLRRYDNGRYKGLVSREISSFIIPVSSDNGYLYDGFFYVLENTKHSGRSVDFGIDDAIPAKFKIGSDGQLSMLEDNGFPSYRSFPTFPDSEISIGDTWEGKAVRAVDPLYKGIVTKMPIYISYTYSGNSVFDGEDVFVINAQWATRYGMGIGSMYIDYSGDSDLLRASGSHNAKIYVSKESGNSVLIQDNVDETYFYNDGNQIRFKGIVSLFTKYPPAVDRMKFLPALKRIAYLTDEDVEKLKEPVDKFPDKIFSGTDKKKIETDYGYNIFKDDDETVWELIDEKIDDIDNLKEKNPHDNPDSKKINKKDDIYKELSGNKKITNSDNKSGDNYDPEGKEIKITVDNTPAGIRLTMENLQFLPDSAQLISGQLEKLDDIIEVLKTVPDNLFLVEGHTASTGYEEGEMKLSIERAEAIAREISARGISRSRIICKGSGGTKPIADNNTYEGKAKNRRVEITILD